MDASHRTFADDSRGGGGGGGSIAPGTADLPVGPTEPGVLNTYARADHQHPILTVANAAGMSALVVTTMPNGTPVYVASRDAVFRLVTSAKTVNTWDTFASTDAARQWLRDGRVSLKSATVATWTVNTATGSDDAVGTGVTPLKTLSELSWRLYGTKLLANVLVQLTGSMAAADLPMFNFMVVAGVTFTIEGQPVAIYTSTITAIPTVTTAGPSITENTITDAAVPAGSFTAAGAMANGVMGSRTVGGAAFWWFAKDKGATVARISVPTAALANGNTYQAQTLPTINALRFSECRFNACVIRQCFTAASFSDSCLRFERCFFNAVATLPAVAFVNCAWQGQNSFQVAASARNGLISTGGMVRGTGAESFIFTVPFFVISGSLTFQAARISIQGGFLLINADQCFYDYTGVSGWFVMTDGAAVSWFVGAAVGIGSTGPMATASRASKLSHVVNPLWLAGQTTNAAPIIVNGTGALTVAQENAAVGVTNAQQNGIFPTT